MMTDRERELVASTQDRMLRQADLLFYGDDGDDDDDGEEDELADTVGTQVTKPTWERVNGDCYRTTDRRCIVYELLDRSWAWVAGRHTGFEPTRYEAQHSAVESMRDPAGDAVDHPAHYETGCGFECIDVLLETQGREAVMAFCLCNAMKYLYRRRMKNGAEDVAKARWYLDKYIELEGWE